MLVSIDSLRADHLHCYGYPERTSPNIDRLAAQGVLFENAIADSSWTLPTHASMLTGLTSGAHRVSFDGHRLDPRRTTLAELLASAGYATLGLYSGPYLHPIFGLDQGFDAYEGVVPPSAYDDPTGFAALDPQRAARERRALNQASHRTVTSPELTRRALEFLERSDGGPFFLFVHYFDVHYDYVPPEEIWRRFDPDYGGDLTGIAFSDDRRIHRDMPERELRHLRALYDGEIFFTDHYVGRLLDGLAALDLSEQTLVVITADHGEEFFEHGHKGHRKSLFDEVLRVPLLLRYPDRLPAGLRVEAQARQIDLLPTILELLGLPVPEEVQGASLLSGALGDAPDPPQEVLSRLVLPGTRSLVSLRTPDWKLVVGGGESTPPALFDLARDPSERMPLGPTEGGERFARAAERLAARQGEERALAERLPSSNIGIELPADLRGSLEQLGYAE